MGFKVRMANRGGRTANEQMVVELIQVSKQRENGKGSVLKINTSKQHMPMKGGKFELNGSVIHYFQIKH